MAWLGWWAVSVLARRVGRSLPGLQPGGVEAFQQPSFRYTEGGEDVTQFGDVDTTLSGLVLAHPGLRLPQLFGDVELRQALFFAQFAQQTEKPSVLG